MKTNIKLKDFLDKETLQKNLETKIKKATMALSKQTGLSLPFQYEFEYFDDGGSFLSIGIAKELQNVFQKQRSKGQGKDSSGKAVKVDKKKVAYGQITCNKAGIYEFLVEGGILKKMQLKQAIKSIGILKKLIGDQFVILDKLPVPTDTTSNPTLETQSPTNDSAAQKKRALRHKKQQKIQKGTDKISDALGQTDAEKIKANIAKLQQALVDLEAEALANGGMYPEEQAQIDACRAQLQGLQAHQERLGNRTIKMTPQNRQAVQDKLAQAKAYLAKIRTELGQ